MASERLTQKEDLLYKLGLLFGPVVQLVERGNDASTDDRTRVLARYSAEHQALIADFQTFSKGEAGHDYRIEYHSFHNALYKFPKLAAQSPDMLPDLVNQTLSIAKDAIRSIPVYAESQIVDTQTPFSTYCKLKTFANLASSKLVFVDRFLHQSIFFRYLSDLQPNVVVTLVGPRRVMTNDFLDLSRMLALERGSTMYRLLSVPYRSIHDRWVRYDDEMLHLGNSTAQAAMINDFTIARLAPTQENFDRIESIIASATEQFGPTQLSHPQTRADLVQ